MGCGTQRNTKQELLDPNFMVTYFTENFAHIPFCELKKK